MTALFPASAALHGAPLTPSQVAQWMDTISSWADAGLSVDQAIKRMQSEGLTLVQCSLLIQTYMALPDRGSRTEVSNTPPMDSGDLPDVPRS